MENRKYCNNLYKYSRLKTREVMVGSVGIGGNNPIRIQSMTTTNTMDTTATVEQTIRMYKSGSELVRITAPSLSDAKNLKNIKDELLRRGFNIPLIADIHFTPNAAEEAARIVEKVRVNPGNYVDKKKFNKIDYTDNEYNDEIERIAERFAPLVKVCKEYGTAMRIGTNHGSLSDRIMSRYGDTPLGMVESALEFVRICRAENYHNIVLSMKSSNPLVMVHAYRLLVNKMLAEGMDYPLHLGVTEAGDGDDARIKSAVGIGTLLEDGIGDTIRVSLTEPPENESPVAKKIVEKYSLKNNSDETTDEEKFPTNPFVFKSRKTKNVLNIGGSNHPVVVADARDVSIDLSYLKEIGFTFINGNWMESDLAADYIYLGKRMPSLSLPDNLFGIIDFDIWMKNNTGNVLFPLLELEEFLSADEINSEVLFVQTTLLQLSDSVLDKIKSDPRVVVVLSRDTDSGIHEQRQALWEFVNAKLLTPILLKTEYRLDDAEQLVLDASTDFGALLLEGLGNGVWIYNKDQKEYGRIISTSFGILQATRARITKTEYISCPSCGRTLFDLVEVTNKIRNRTNHLKGVKIGIMGCIVNGPGEMADADYGYVGSGVGKISLYRGQEVVVRNLDEDEAVEKLIELIKADGCWVEKK